MTDKQILEEVDKAMRLGARQVLDTIRAEIDIARFIDKDTKLCKNANASGLEVAMNIIDKYRTGSNETQTNEIVYDVGGHMYGAMGGDVIMDILAGKGKK